MTSTDDALIRQSIDKIEDARKRRGISVREAASNIRGISEGYWRQFVAGGVKQSGIWVPKTPTPEQLVKMASAVGIGGEVASDLGVEPLADLDLDRLDALEQMLEAALAELNRLKRERQDPGELQGREVFRSGPERRNA